MNASPTRRCCPSIRWHALRPFFVYRIEKDWAALVDAIQSSRSDNVVKKSVKELKESLVAVAPIFMEKPFL